jgi:hypothetical protein
MQGAPLSNVTDLKKPGRDQERDQWSIRQQRRRWSALRDREISNEIDEKK